MRVVAFAFLTPFFFLKGGMNVSTGALWANLGILALLFAGKMIPKLVGVYPLARRYTAPHAVFTTLLMSTGLTFGTITSLYGLNAGHHRPDAVLAAARGGRPLGDRADGDRPAVLLSPSSEELRDITAPVPPAGLAGLEAIFADATCDLVERLRAAVNAHIEATTAPKAFGDVAIIAAAEL